MGFVNQVSHELRTPLTNIRLYAELLERRVDEDDEKTRSYLDIIVAECGRLSRLIGNVLSFARRSRGALTIHPVEGSVDDIAEVGGGSVPALVRRRGASRSLSIWMSPRPVAFDPDAIEQVVGIC